MQGRGQVSLWGFTRALNLSEHCSVNEPNVLLIGASDPRHILETVKQTGQHFTFHLIESQAPVIARIMILLEILLNDHSLYSAQDRAERFLEVYGNILIRKQTADYIQDKINYLIRAVTDSTGFLAEFMDFTSLKFKERDDLEFVLKFWKDNSKKFDLETMWEFRLRNFLQTRYDSRENLFDWDYHMKLATENTLLDMINPKEYKKWRETGIAFEIREATLNIPNRTFATVQPLKENGVSVSKWGYFSDIIHSPYLAFGTNTRLKKVNGQYQTNAQLISLENLNNFNKFSKFNIKVLPFDPEATLKKQKKYDLIYLGAHQAHLLPRCVELANNGSTIIVETASLLLDLSPEQQEMYKLKILEFGKRLKLSATDRDYFYFTT